MPAQQHESPLTEMCTARWLSSTGNFRRASWRRLRDGDRGEEDIPAAAGGGFLWIPSLPLPVHGGSSRDCGCQVSANELRGGEEAADRLYG